MKPILINKTYFGLLFFALLFIDIGVKIFSGDELYRLFSKPLIILSLIAFFRLNKSKSPKEKFVIWALFCYLIGDILFIFYENTVLYLIGILLFLIGKIFYAFKFSNQRDFNIFKLIPFFLITFTYMVFIMLLVMNNLGAFLIPTLLYLFACLILLLFAYLRKGAVNYKSFIVVLIGVILSILCDSITLIQSFYYEDFPYHQFLIMFIYGLYQYLIINGLLLEQKKA